VGRRNEGADEARFFANAWRLWPGNVVIEAASPPTLAGALQSLAGTAPALVGLDRTLDYTALRQAVLGVSTWLVQQGVPPGSRVAILQKDGPWAAAMLLGVCHAHAAVPLNPNLSAQEYGFATADFGVAAVAAEQDLPAAARLHDVTAPVLSFAPWIVPPAGEEAPAAAGPEAPAFLLHTSGTTARPKRVVLTQGRICQSAHVIARSLQLGPGDRCLTGMPMFHVHGILNAMSSTLVSGGSFAHCGAFDTIGFYQHMKNLRPTWSTAFPPCTTRWQRALSSCRRSPGCGCCAARRRRCPTCSLKSSNACSVSWCSLPTA